MPSQENLKKRFDRETPDELKIAEQLYRKRDFDGVLKHLAPQVFLYRANPRYYQLLGISSLYVNDFSGAHSYLLRGLDLAPENTAMKMGLAISFLWRKEEPQAIASLLAILEKHPRHFGAKRALDVLKRAPDSPEWRTLLMKGVLRRLYPRPPIYIERIVARGSMAAGILLGLAVVAFGIVQLVNALSGIRTQRDPVTLQTIPTPAASTPEVSGVANGSPGLGDFVALSVSQGKQFYKLDSAALADLSQTAISSFREYRDNRARYALNKIMLSNAANAEKEKHRSLYQYLRKPDFTNFKDNPVFQDIVKDPPIHDGMYVRWRGRISGVARGDNQLRFALFVGYDSGAVALGKVNIHLAFPAELFDGENVELIGQIHVGSSNDADPQTGAKTHPELAKSDEFWVEATSIRQVQGSQ